MKTDFKYLESDYGSTTWEEKAVITNENIGQYIARQTDVNIEFKYGTLVADIIGKIICGYANTSGGFIVVGYSEKKQKTYGYSHNDEKILNTVMNSFENVPHCEKYYVNYQDHRLLIIEVEKNENFISLYNGIAYVYQNDGCFALSGEEFKKRILSQSEQSIHELLPKMQDTLIELSTKVNDYEIGLAKSDKKALIYCIVGIIGGAVQSNIPTIVGLLQYLVSLLSASA